MSSHLHGYEVSFISHPEMSDIALKALKDKILALVASFEGEVVLTEDWGKKKFAYPIKKQTRGYIVYQAPGTAVAEIERHLKLNEHILRFLTVQLKSPFSSSGFKKARQEYHAAVKRRDEEREQRREYRDDGRRSYERSSYETKPEVGEFF